MSFLSRAFGVQPRRPHAVRVQRDLVIPAGDGVPLLASRFCPDDVDQAPLVLLRTPYGHGSALDRMPQLMAERGCQVLSVSLRGTDDSGGKFDGFTIHPADGDGTLSWLREQPWFGGVQATWGASYLGLVQWELGARDIPEWKIAVIQDARSQFAHQFMYPGGGFALGWVQIVDRMFRANGGRMAHQLFGVLTGPKSLRRAVATLPVADADITPTGPRGCRGSRSGFVTAPTTRIGRPLTLARTSPGCRPWCTLQGGWYDFFLAGMLADYAELQAAGRTVRLLIGLWDTAAASSPAPGCVTHWPRWNAVLGDGTPPSGGVFVTGSRSWIDLPRWHRHVRDTAWYLHPAGRLGAHTAVAGPPSRFRHDQRT